MTAAAGGTILVAILFLMTGFSSAQGGLGNSGGPMDPYYAASEISVHPEPPVAGNPTVLCADVTNPTPYSHFVLLEFSVGPFGIGVPFEPVGETEVEVPAGGKVTGCVTWVPPGPGPWSIQVRLIMAGYDEMTSQRNLDMDEPLEPGVPHSREFTVRNSSGSTADVTLGLIPHLVGWGIELSPDVLENMAPDENRIVTLTVTPPAGLPQNGTPIVDVEGYIAAELIGGFRKIYTTDVEECEGDFDGDGDVDGSDLATFAADFGRTDCTTGAECEGDFDHDNDVDGSDLAVFAADFGRTDCPKMSPLDATVTGRIVCPGLVACMGNPPPQDIRVEVRNSGITNSTPLDGNYEFSLRIPNGEYDLSVYLDHPDLNAPAPVPVSVGPGGSLDVGDMELLLKDAAISGRVVDGLGVDVPYIPVLGAEVEGFGRAAALADVNGEYVMSVIGGEWSVEPKPEPFQPFVFRHDPKIVRVAGGGAMMDVDFVLTEAPALIRGVAVDADTLTPISGLPGETKAEQLVVPPDGFEFFSGGLLLNGAFELKAQDGWDYRVSLDLPPDAPYVSGSDLITVPAGQLIKEVEIPLAPKNAVIEGVLLDVLTGLEPTVPITAKIYAEDNQGHWTRASVGDEYSYSLGVAADSICTNPWDLSVHIALETGYAPLEPVLGVCADPSMPTTQNLFIQPINTTISGHVVAPDGTTPEPDALVFAEGNSPYGGYFRAETNCNPYGEFELLVREGEYVLGASLPATELETRGWANPTSIEGITVSAAGPSSGWDLAFRELDGEIHGTVSFDPTIVFDPSWNPTHPAYVRGWSEDGESAEADAMVVQETRTFTYSIPVVSGTVWHVGAVYEDYDNGVYYESPEQTVTVTGQVVQNLVLQGPYLSPQPFIVSFNGTQMQTIVFPDGVGLSIPAGALLTTGASNNTVTLFIFSTEAREPQPGNEVIGPGYEIWAVDADGAEITQFNANVGMTFYYPPDATLEAQGISEYKLIPVYYSTIVGNWILAKSYVVDTTNNQITLQLVHF